MTVPCVAMAPWVVAMPAPRVAMATRRNAIVTRGTL
jgi:hypothetical protein